MTTIRWHKNGDHPDDNVGATLEDPLNPGVTYVRQEGAVVRYFRHPDIPDLDTHTECGQVWRDHGWIDQGDGSFVCPGDHQPENCDPANLMAMCQACHLAYDRDHHADTRRARQEQ